MTSVSTSIKEALGLEGNLKNLHDTFVDMLQDVYDAEHRLVEALPLMAEAAQNRELKTAFKHHLEETRTHVSRLEDVFESIYETPERKPCQAIKGLIDEASEVIDNAEEPARDAGLAAAGNAVEHYEMARYGTLACWAEEMGHKQAASLLRQTLAEEEKADSTLTKLAEKTLNAKAAEGLGSGHAAHLQARGKAGHSTSSRRG